MKTSEQLQALKDEAAEVWMPVLGYEKNYAVSNLGRIRSLTIAVNAYNCKIIKRGRIIKPNTVKGYSRVNLSMNNIRVYKSVHRLVAIAFIPNPDNKPEVNHINGIKNDNRIENLEWCTKSENQIHYNSLVGKAALTPGRLYGLSLGNKNNKRPVIQYDLNGGFLNEWEYMRVAAKALNMNVGSISQCCIGTSKSSGGFIWKYKKQKND